MRIDDIRPMADEVATLMAARMGRAGWGGARRGTPPDLDLLLRRRAGALPRRLRREARIIADAARMAGQPRLACQVDLVRFQRAHGALIRQLGPALRNMDGPSWATTIAARVVLGLMVLAAVALWILLRRGVI
jgi:hypothetical protein